jgi:hypothetical protein
MNRSKIVIQLMTLVVFFASVLRADVVTQGFEDFSTTAPPTAPGSQTVNDWTINDMHVLASFGPVVPHSGGKLGFFPDVVNSGIASPTNCYVASSVLSNGVGDVSFYLQNVTFGGGTGPFSCDLQVNTNGSWNTVATIDNTGKSGWIGYTNTLNIYDPIQIRLFRNSVGVSSFSWLALDDISTTEAPAKVDISDVSITPSQPEAGDAVDVSAILTPSTLATVTNVSLLWSANGGATNTISMSYNGGTGRYETDNAISNQTAFTVIHYTVRVDFSGPTPLSPTTVSDSFFFRKPLPQSAYSSVSVKGDLTQTLDLVEDGYWEGVKSVAALGQTDLYFETVNGATLRWSDPDPIRTNLPVFGAFATNVVSDIRIAGSDAGWLLLSFDENSGRYGIQQTDYQSFNTWSSASGGFNTYTIDGWTLTRGRTTTDAALAFDSYSVQFESTTAERAIASPELPNGIGTISFRYRNTETNGLSPAAFVIQVRATNTVAWSTVEAVTNIIAPDYLYHSFTVASLDQRYIRIAALSGTATAQLLIDDIIVTRPGATVTFSGLDHSPTPSTVTNTVDVTVDVTALNGGEINDVTLWFRGESSEEPLELTYLPITFTNLTGRGTLTDFPALIKLNAFNTDNYSGFLDITNGYDLRFYDNPSFADPALDYEIESFDTNGTSYVWVKIPALTQDTEIWATWGIDATQQDSTTNGATWASDFKAVWHMGETDGLVQDSTSNDNDAYAVNSVPSATAGLIGAANDFNDDQNDYIKVAYSSDFAMNNPAMTVSAWVYAHPDSGDASIAGCHSSGWIFALRDTTPNDELSLYDGSWRESGTAVPDNAWTHVAYTFHDNQPNDATDGRFYVNGTLVASVDAQNRTVDKDVYIGSGGPGWTSQVFDGLIDELRFSNAARSTNWVWAEYMNQGSNHDTFVSYGTPTVLPSGIPETPYDAITMTNTTGDTYRGTIPRGIREEHGVMQYYVEASYLNPATGGYQSSSEPLDVTGMPVTYTNTDVAAGFQGFEDFAATSLPSAPGSQTVNDWTINDLHVRPSLGPAVPHSGSQLAFFPNSDNSGISSPTNCYVVSPVLSNGVGSVSFYLNNLTFVGGTGPFSCELQVNTNGTWNTVATIDNTGTSGWVGYTNALNIHDSVQIRLFRNAEGTVNMSWLGIDDISMTYPPAYVTAYDFEEHPAYPSQEEATTVACTIESATTYHPAFNIVGTLQYRYRMQQNGSLTDWTGWTPVAMTRFGSRFYGEIPALPSLSEVEYYVDASFSGYSAEGEDQSPMAFPETPLEYSVRRYISAFDRIAVQVGAEDYVDFEQAGNGQWEGVITFINATNQPDIGIAAYDYYDGTNVAEGLFATWGDNNQFRTNMPLAGTATIGAIPITIPENAVGQYIIRFDENTGIYTLQRGAFQDFENWPADSATFGESYAAAEITQHIQDFDDWAISGLGVSSWSDDFEAGWEAVNDYPDNWSIDEFTLTGGTNIGYYMRSGIVVTQVVGQAGLLAPSPERGYLYNATAGDVGSIAFDLRVASPNDFRPAMHPAVTNTHFRIDAKIRATDVPTNSAIDSFGMCYKSIIGNYIDDNNYYEARANQISGTQKRLEVWKKSGGTFSRLTTKTMNGTIGSDEILRLMIYRYSASSVKIRIQSDGTRQDVNDTSALPAAYAFGLNSMDASVDVDYVSVYEVLANNFSVDPDVVYNENFNSDPPADWDDNGGIWSVSGGRYTRPGYTGSPITARVEFSTTTPGDVGAVIETFTNLTHTGYRRYTAYPHIATNGYVRIRNQSGSGYVIIDNVVRTGWRGEVINTNGWVTTNGWVHTDGEAGNGFELRHSHALAGAQQSIVSPTLTDGASVVTFDYMPAADASGPVSFAIDYEEHGFPGVWNTNLHTVTDSSSPTNWVSFSYSIPDRDLRADISLIRIRNLTAGHDDGLMIDNLAITEPPPINDTTWWGYNVLVTDQQPDGIIANATTPWLAHADGNQFGAFINNSMTNDTGSVTNNEYVPFIQSAYLPDGIGEIRFQYRAWDDNESQIQIVASTNRTTPSVNDWLVLDTLTVNSTDYQEYYNAIFERNYTYVALRVNSILGSFGRVGVDNILITAPLAADLRLSNVRTIPESPLAYEDVYVEVTVDDLFFSPSDIELQLLHKTGTNSWGDHTSSIRYDMHVEYDYGTSFVFRSDWPIQNKPTDTVVQYQVEASFSGFFAEKSSPKYVREFETPDNYWPIDLNDGQITRTPYFIVLSSIPGQVWINEFNINDDSYGTDRQFIELAGVGNVPIGNWRVENLSTDTNIVSSYTIDGGTRINGSADEFGFYVFGTTNVSPYDVELTNQLAYSGGIQLIRPVTSLGKEIIEQRIAYDTFGSAGQGMVSPDNRFVYVGFDDDWGDYSIGMTGTGSNLTDFATNWVNTSTFTIGGTNSGQTLIPWPTNDVVIPDEYTGTATIGTASLNGGLVYFDISTQATNLVPSVWYVTNLLNVTSNDWLERTSGFGYSRSNTSYSIWCDQVPPPVFYSIKVTREP